METCPSEMSVKVKKTTRRYFQEDEHFVTIGAKTSSPNSGSGSWPAEKMSS
jgi:hypothetical protein